MVFKCNTLTDPEIIEALYAASQAGVTIDLIVRGVCCLRPGTPGLSDGITVRSIVGRFLEHSRLLLFRNGGEHQVYLTSADLVSRNLDSRVEVMWPVEDKRVIERLRHDVLRLYLADTVNAYLLRSDGSYVRVDGKPCDSQALLLQRAISEGEPAANG